MMTKSVWLLLLCLLFAGCAGLPWETNQISRDGRVYRESENTEDGTRTNVKVNAAQF